MNTHGLLLAQQQHLAGLLEAIQRCVYFLHASDSGIAWPLTGDFLSDRKKDNDLFEALAAINERFAKLQDTMGAACCFLASKPIASSRYWPSLRKTASSSRWKTGRWPAQRAIWQLTITRPTTTQLPITSTHCTLSSPVCIKRLYGLCTMHSKNWAPISPAQILPASLLQLRPR